MVIWVGNSGREMRLEEGEGLAGRNPYSYKNVSWKIIISKKEIKKKQMHPATISPSVKYPIKYMHLFLSLTLEFSLFLTSGMLNLLCSPWLKSILTYLLSLPNFSRIFFQIHYTCHTLRTTACKQIMWGIAFQTISNIVAHIGNETICVV